ncbi:hypothetical protein GYMLUDRAFT_71434 [Collybiopsis luxurians FD-317 M1]|uniref:NYN domain-containing protein n=1 Tax=Collybiopsis luxurians FD-317 M1 TaxID=944289 RepID=A0A0D0CLT2_9AGAR|nr:hypothetical protein GYMLUDRAFT_71434 [Collybiopsis luxurians FD-317 M1]
MIRSISDTTTASTSSPTPASPFSSDHSVPSEPTSDETPDLGAFNVVLRAWNSLQPAPRIFNSTLAQPSLPSSSSFTATTSSDLREGKSTVWSHRPIANYLTLSGTLNSDSEITDRDQPRAVQIQSEDSDDISRFDENDIYDNSDARDESDEQQLQLSVQEFGLHDVEEQPSLGYLDEALKFIAAERERWTAQREADANAAIFAGIEPRKKRRRKRNKTTPRAQSTTRTPTLSSFSITTSGSTITTSTAQGDDLDDVVDVVDALGAEADDSSSSIDQQSSPLEAPRGTVLFRSTPGTPARRGRGRGRAGLQHSRSTPQLRMYNRNNDEEEEDSNTDPVTEDSPRLKLMKLLRKKLETLFPEDRQYLQKVQFRTAPAETGHHQLGSVGYFSSADTESMSRNVVLGEFVDTRGPNAGKNDERLIYVFVDHSNILIGLLNYLRRYPGRHPQYRAASYNGSQPKPPKHLSHSALTLILERGRPIARRVLVASSPLYQPLQSAERLGFEVRVFARVPDTGDGMDRERSSNYGSSGKQGHKRSQSSGSSFNSHSGTVGATGNVGSSPTDSPMTQRRQRKRAGSINNHNSNNNNSNPNISSNGSFTVSGRRKGHSRKTSDNTSAESEQNGGGLLSVRGFSQGFTRTPGGSIPYGHHTYSHSLPTSNNSTPPIHPNLTSTLAPAAIINPAAAFSQQQPQRIRYREQGVDELLQLKLHQVLASIDGPPPKNSTIILATGDGNVGQFNEDGFLGGVRTALRRGWNVELYAWEGGLSRAWKREFGEGSEWAGSGSKSTFRVVGMEQFGSELVEIYY